MHSGLRTCVYTAITFAPLVYVNWKVSHSPQILLNTAKAFQAQLNTNFIYKALIKHWTGCAEAGCSRAEEQPQQRLGHLLSSDGFLG